MTDFEKKLKNMIERKKATGRVSRQLLLTQKNRADLPELYAQEELGDDAIIHVKFFTPSSCWTWYATEFDGEDRFFGLACGDWYPELGYFSLSDLVNSPIAIERDLHFGKKTLAEMKKHHNALA